ncbi:4-hydroxybenzoate octaprenyltransferase [Pseudoalteromonas sp. CO348]|uniref:4-hydroxybenzoate octaprenyltransferase n=1 Tax=Pseudoalteromonas maricaloris TaxID=184924 RepID=A0A8I2H5M0_9GAMM|nr:MULTISPECIES: 4-hydroxybenzoate octaprenyltransferase [Pseudoalteromonas]NLR22397.1 4-hydroxybenzoate octaprenyltransferase [Pseudoalteromonas maricaloris]RZG08998.1 4-hydroxybenzoate octaprenyltransferase [Pseudoalteromonas sp. CO348]WOX28005.1 4-hydroxybenzoate octaprenyltransferase [Pseudoalteromonas maricaloris]
MIDHQKWQAYSQLMRLDKPIGTLLLLWPTLWSLWFAAEGVPSIWLIVIFALGVLVMRSAGCVINDFADRKVDGAVKRTATRPLARGAVTSKEALGLFAILVAVAFILVLFLNWQTIVLSLGALALASVYPFMKRYTNLPQLVLGAAFSWAIPMAFMAVNQNVSVLAWVLFVANLIWTVAYDTMYAMVDRDDDLKIGVKSTAILFGKWDLHIIALLNITFIAMMAAVGVTFDLNLAFWCGLLAASVLLIRQQYAIRYRDRDRCFWAFLNNNYVGLAIFVGVVLGFLPL